MRCDNLTVVECGATLAQSTWIFHNINIIIVVVVGARSRKTFKYLIAMILFRFEIVASKLSGNFMALFSRLQFRPSSMRSNRVFFLSRSVKIINTAWQTLHWNYTYFLQLFAPMKNVPRFIGRYFNIRLWHRIPRNVRAFEHWKWHIKKKKTKVCRHRTFGSVLNDVECKRGQLEDWIIRFCLSKISWVHSLTLTLTPWNVESDE